MLSFGIPHLNRTQTRVARVVVHFSASCGKTQKPRREEGYEKSREGKRGGKQKEGKRGGKEGREEGDQTLVMASDGSSNSRPTPTGCL
jgi:hypothetical protein